MAGSSDDSGSGGGVGGDGVVEYYSRFSLVIPAVIPPAIVVDVTPQKEVWVKRGEAEAVFLSTAAPGGSGVDDSSSNVFFSSPLQVPVRVDTSTQLQVVLRTLLDLVSSIGVLGYWASSVYISRFMSDDGFQGGWREEGCAVKRWSVSSQMLSRQPRSPCAMTQLRGITLRPHIYHR